MMSNKTNTAILIIALAVTVVGCTEKVATKKETKPPVAVKKVEKVEKSEPVGGFTLGVEQHGKRIRIDDSKKVMLERAPFRLVFYFREHGSMLVNASFSPDIMTRANNGGLLDKLLLKDAAIAEDFGNSDKLLCIRNSGEYQNWLCFGKEEHRFDFGGGVKVIPAGYESGYLCRRTIDMLDTGNATIEVEKCPSDVIYMLFVKMTQKPGTMDRVEKKRECLEIHFKKTPIEYSSR